mmetsp:Transcript_3562/g.6229  ORF Transcript_3562/g.6229 Transcript_3562/m.6229 type:complete len:328 (-) Transcript_3562:605-1588(-)
MPPDTTTLDGEAPFVDDDGIPHNDDQGDNGSNNNNDADDEHADTNQYLFLIRHGDRWDYSYPEWKQLPTSRLGDSPLSPLGHQQAREVGTFLASWLEHGHPPSDTSMVSIDSVTWLSSPFLRCLQTSNDALNAMLEQPSQGPSEHAAKKLVSDISILPEYSIFEWDGHDGEWHKDLPPLEERKHYFPRLDLSYESFFVPSLPEPRSAFFDRCQRTVDTFHQRFPHKPRQVIVMVSHAAGCIALAKTLTKKQLTDITPAGPCSIYMFTRTSNDAPWKLDDHDKPNGMNGYTGHLSEMGTSTKPWNNFGDGVTKYYTGPLTSRFHPDKL